jgi:TRAP-type mannitol/chloroaromatic compound transport system substrate-binding protein
LFLARKIRAARADSGGADTGDCELQCDGDVWEGVSYSIDMQCHQSSTEQLTSSTANMVSLIDQVTNGAVQIKAYESVKLYSTADCFEAVSSGD